MARAGAVLVAICTVLVTAPSVLAYTYHGACNSNDNTTWDILNYYPSTINGAEMRQYQLPASNSWAICTGTSGNGHLDELLSIQSASGIVQLGITKEIDSGVSGWHFIYTPDDGPGGLVVSADFIFGQGPMAGRSYRFRITYDGTFSPEWDYCIKDLTFDNEVCWFTDSHWHSSTYAWFGGETRDFNDTMGARPESDTFHTYAMRTHNSGGWSGYLSDSTITNGCAQLGYNRFFDNCNVEDVGPYPGLFVWND